MGKYKRRFGDRYDGRLIRSADPFFKIVPYVMKSRADSQVYFSTTIDLTPIEEYIKNRRKSGKKNISFLHVVIAALVRTISQRPAVNRFVAGQKIYARNDILLSLAVKKEMRIDSPETTLKLKFEPTDTLDIVADRVSKAIEENKELENSNGTDKTAKIVSLCPGFIIKFIVWFLSTLDYFGKMPKVINRVSPFHTSVFITDMGSLGIDPVYHHIYNFGTTSCFLSFGIKRKEKVVDKDNQIVEKRFIDIRVVGDERIVDGFYYASAFKLFKKFIQHPELLENAPEQVVEDIV